MLNMVPQERLPKRNVKTQTAQSYIYILNRISKQNFVNGTRDLKNSIEIDCLRLVGTYFNVLCRL